MRQNGANYNIINSAFNFSEEEDIMLVIDGDDELLGRYAFHVMNAGYQKYKDDLWVYYSNHKTNFYSLGRSKAIVD